MDGTRCGCPSVWDGGGEELAVMGVFAWMDVICYNLTVL